MSNMQNYIKPARLYYTVNDIVEIVWCVYLNTYLEILKHSIPRKKHIFTIVLPLDAVNQWWKINEFSCGILGLNTANESIVYFW